MGRSVDEALRLVKAFQFTDKNGEVCPANWQDGGDTVRRGAAVLSLLAVCYPPNPQLNPRPPPSLPQIKPDVEGKKEYFSKN